ncbi:hypothetical protein P5G50_02640 [Leifsonia sp. F6_8S_P_1B]|uniref:Uncharacterized protein n=1 Tax=Leifsonia williamsii TaxID=3035919 RepID=A0ABT8K7B0_9MICO|nr:hypothetical protein [Leifsonia williamsii]MDN4613340.1 hypothetical protein [Leifsonia williamsii]
MSERSARPDLRITVAGAPADAFGLRTTWAEAEPGWAVTVEVAYTGAEPVDASLLVEAVVPHADDPWWLIPGAFYGENRPIENTRAFPRFERGASTPEQHAALISDTWEFRADRAATPAVFVWAGPGRGGLALAAAETTALGLTGVGLAHDDASGQAALSLRFPYREYPVTYYGDAQPRPADTSTHRFIPGETVEVEVRVFALDADRHAYAPVLRALHAESAPAAPLAPWVDVATAADLTADGLLTWHYDPDPGVLLETVGFDREVSGRDGETVDRQAMHVGWVSGIPWAYALLAHGLRTSRPAEADAARRVIDFICSSLSPSGTFWGVWYRDHGWTQSWTELKRGLHSRTLAEATLFLLRAQALDRHDVWEAAIRSNLSVIVGRQRDDGNLGSVHHAETGEVLSWSGASGLTWIAALVEAADRDERYLPSALAAGRYYESFVDREFVHGAPEDVDLAPTSEDGYAAVMAYVALHRATGDAHWLDVARRAADWMLTFRYTYDVAFPPHTLLGAYGFRTRGADNASPSNQHLHAYGLVCTAELRELSEALDDPFYAERAEETLACFRQFIAREDGDFNAYRGMVSERYYQTACFQPKGMLLTLSHAWSVGVTLLACEQTLAAGQAAARDS